MAGKLEIGVNWETRLCTVNGETGYFYIWEQYSKLINERMSLGTETRVFSKVFGIVEFPDGVRRVDPLDIHFCDEKHSMLHVLNERRKDD